MEKGVLGVSNGEGSARDEKGVLGMSKGEGSARGK